MANRRAISKVLGLLAVIIIGLIFAGLAVPLIYDTTKATNTSYGALASLINPLNLSEKVDIICEPDDLDHKRDFDKDTIPNGVDPDPCVPDIFDLELVEFSIAPTVIDLEFLDKFSGEITVKNIGGKDRSGYSFYVWLDKEEYGEHICFFEPIAIDVDWDYGQLKTFDYTPYSLGSSLGSCNINRLESRVMGDSTPKTYEFIVKAVPTINELGNGNNYLTKNIEVVSSALGNSCSEGGRLCKDNVMRWCKNGIWSEGVSTCDGNILLTCDDGLWKRKGCIECIDDDDGKGWASCTGQSA